MSKLELKWYNATKKLERNDLRMLKGFLTEHDKIAGHLKKLCIEEKSVCRFCGDEEETPIHLLLNCGDMFRKKFQHLYCPTDRALYTN